MKKKTVFALLIVCFTVSRLFAASLEELVGPAYAAQLRSGGAPITEMQKNSALQLLPQHTALRQFVSGVIAALEPNVAVETLFLYTKPGVSGEWTEAQRVGLFNQILAISRLTGVQYYSASRKAMRTFYESSHVIDSPDSGKQRPDPVFAQPPVSLTLYARQKDLTFGDNIYRYDYKTAQDAFFFVQENITALNYGIITVVAKNKLRSVMAVIDCDDSLLIYSVSLAKAVSFFGLDDRIGNSFSNRAEAVFKWFTGRADSVFTVK
jgi:hypothetical protein